VLKFLAERFGKPFGFSEWNPQAEFISVEENRAFRGYDGTHLFNLLFKQLEILISSYASAH